MHFVGFLQWLGNTPLSNLIRGSVWAEPIIETTHVLTLTLFLGFAVLLDLRLLGILLVRRRVSEVLRQLNPWLAAGFAVMAISGALLFLGDPVSFYSTSFFKVKMLLLVLAGLDVLIFNWTVGRKTAQWDLNPKTPVGAKAAAVISLLLWVAIVAAGRGIAYAVPPPS